MEAVIFCGIQASGKTTFYRERFFETHVRLSLDQLRTRSREQILLDACLRAQQPFVVDNTNITRAARAGYIASAKAAGFRVIGYFFPADPKAAFARNRLRAGRAAVPAAGLFGAQKRLEPPMPDEGFDELHRVDFLEGQGFVVSDWTPPAAAPPGRGPPGGGGRDDQRNGVTFRPLMRGMPRARFTGMPHGSPRVTASPGKAPRCSRPPVPRSGRGPCTSRATGS